jgi:hypothetical protein
MRSGDGNMLEHRLRSAHIPESQCRLLPKEFVVETIERLDSRLPERGGVEYVRRAVRDVSDDDRQAVVDWVQALDLPAMDWVNVFWIADREGVSMSLNNFIQHYDDLWYPAADDVWICPSSGEWVLEFSHEEEVSLYVRRQPSP